MKWSEVTARPEFNALSDAEQEASREAYFQEVVAPQFKPDQLQSVRERFDSDTAIPRVRLTPGAGPGRTMGEQRMNAAAQPAVRQPRTRGGLPSETARPFVAIDNVDVPEGKFQGRSGVNYNEPTVARDGGLSAPSSGAAPDDQMLSQSFVDKERQGYQSVPLEYRREAIIENAKRPDSVGRAARAILSRMPQEDMAGRIGEGRRPIPLPPSAIGNQKSAAGFVTFPDQRPTAPEMVEGIDSRAAVNRREAGLQTSLQETGIDAMKDRDYRVSGALATESSRKQLAKDAPHLSALMSGTAGGLAGLTNAPAVAADYLNQLVVNPVARAFGAEGFARAPNMPGADYFAKAANQYAPEVMSGGMSKAWDDNKFIPWLITSMAAQAPQMVQQVVAAMVPPLRALILPAMGFTQAGQSYQEGDASSAALSKGVIEAGSELLPLHVFDKVKAAILKLPTAARGAAVAEAMKRLAAAGAAVTASSLTEALEEGASQTGQNLVDIYQSGKKKSVFDKVPDSMVIGGAMGGVMGAPNAARALRGNSAPTPWQEVAQSINQAADAYANFFKPAPEAVAPTAARADSIKRFDEAAAAWGLSPKAAAAVREQAGNMPADDTPGFLARAVQALNRNGLFRAPVDEARVAALDAKLRPPPPESTASPAPQQSPTADGSIADRVEARLRTAGSIPAADQVAAVDGTGLDTPMEKQNVGQPDVAATAGRPTGSGDGGSATAARSELPVGLLPDAPGRVDQPAAAPKLSAGTPGPVADGRGSDSALNGVSRETSAPTIKKALKVAEPSDVLTTLNTLADGFDARAERADKTFATVLRGYAADIKAGKIDPASVAPQIEAYTQLLKNAEPVTAVPVAESLAPAPSEPGDGAVASAHGGSDPQHSDQQPTVEGKFLRKATSTERVGSTERQRAMVNLAKEHGQEVVFKPYGAQGTGFYIATPSVAKQLPANEPSAKPKVYKLRSQAERAKAGNTERLRKVKDGYILRAATDTELAAADRAGRRLAAGSSVDVERDSLLTAIAKMGGLSFKERSDTIGEGNRNIGGKMLFRASGKAIDLMASEDLRDYGYVPLDEVSRDGGVPWLRDAIKREFNGGQPHFSEQGTEWMGGADLKTDAEIDALRKAYAVEEAARLADWAAYDLNEAGYTSNTPEANAITEALLAEAESAGIDTEAIREDAARQTQEGSDDEYHQAVQAAIRRVLPAPAEDAARSEAGGRESSGQDNGQPVVDQGQKEVAAQAAQAAQAEEAARLEVKAAEDKAIAAEEKEKKRLSDRAFNIKIRKRIGALEMLAKCLKGG